MLNAVTKKFTDKSTLKKFRFIFYCDCCSAPTREIEYDFISGFRDKIFLSGDEREARAIIYANDHKRAYERANLEVRFELNKCEKCGNMVCEDCTIYSPDGRILCSMCEK